MRELCHTSRYVGQDRQVAAGDPGQGRVTPVTDDSAVEAGGTQTDSSDWRVTVGLHQSGRAGHAAASLSNHTVEREVHKRLGGRVIVGTDGHNDLYLYTHTRDAAAAARQSVSELLAGQGIQADYTIERWHPVAEQWDPADEPLPDTAAEIAAERSSLDAEETAESLESGVALFEVRVQVPRHHEAVALAERLAAENYSVVRRWRFLVVGANNADQAKEFAAKIRQEAPADAVVTTEEVGPSRPYTVFELAAGSGL
jgi:hypothetical protein